MIWKKKYTISAIALALTAAVGVTAVFLWPESPSAEPAAETPATSAPAKPAGFDPIPEAAKLSEMTDEEIPQEAKEPEKTIPADQAADPVEPTAQPGKVETVSKEPPQSAPPADTNTYSTKAPTDDNVSDGAESVGEANSKIDYTPKPGDEPYYGVDDYTPPPNNIDEIPDFTIIDSPGEEYYGDGKPGEGIKF